MIADYVQNLSDFELIGQLPTASTCLTSHIFYDDQFKVKTNRYRLNLSITVWLLISNLIILGGMDRVDCAWEIVCVISSLALLYSLLTAFAFSLMLSFHLYLIGFFK